MTAQPAPLIELINPLPAALKHYEMELRSVLEAAGYTNIRTGQSESIEGLSGRAEKMRCAIREVRRRYRRRRRVAEPAVTIVLWPALGSLDFLSWWRRALTQQVVVVVHDPIPLRKSHGDSWLAAFLFRHLIGRSPVQLLCHTELAAQVIRQSGASPSVLPHPILSPKQGISGRSDGVVRVLGQFKEARRTDELAHVAATGRMHGLTFQIAGRGWPAIDGWDRIDRFLEEDEFQTLISSSSCVLLPYDRFYQSGVAVRCLESGTPIIGLHHEQLDELYGADWPGLVDTASDWPAAISEVVGSASSADILTAAQLYRDSAVMLWADWLRQAVVSYRIR